jgi:hypothetical protein
MMQNFIISDITANCNNVLIYDERGQGKGADALCSFRLLLHFRLRQERADRLPKMLLLILDNCIGQNKSKVVFMFYAPLSFLFYDKVALLFLIPSHSHNQADCVIAWCRNKMCAQNLYTPSMIVSEFNAIKSVCVEFLDHQSSRRVTTLLWRLDLSSKEVLQVYATELHWQLLFLNRPGHCQHAPSHKYARQQGRPVSDASF